MELRGQVILDEQSMAELRAQIREEVVAEIAESGNTASEIRRYLSGCGFESYVGMIKNTIGHVADGIREDNIHFDSGWKAYRQILAIKALMDV